jgi:hypothetical protein
MKRDTGTTLFCSKIRTTNEVEIVALQFPGIQFGVMKGRARRLSLRRTSPVGGETPFVMRAEPLVEQIIIARSRNDTHWGR